MDAHVINQLPYWYFGGKRSIAHVVWERFGNVKAYVEPFFGGGAVFWLRPKEHFSSGDRRWELLNDIDGMIVNFLRAVYHDPHAVAHYANWYITEVDLTARHIWLVNQKENLVQHLESDPEYYDAKIAGWWVWGMNNWIGSGWCSGQGAWILQNGKLIKKNSKTESDFSYQLNETRTHNNFVLGINKVIPKIGKSTCGILSVNKKRKQISHVNGCLSIKKDLVLYFEELSQRLRVNICKIICGDWKRCLTLSFAIDSGIPVGFFLDPPYAEDRSKNVYVHDDTNLCFEVLAWCKENGKDDRFRIALCGYTGYYDELESLGWTPYYWSSNGGYGNRGQGKGRVNKNREVVWFSPHCLKPVSVPQLELDLFSMDDWCILNDEV